MKYELIVESPVVRSVWTVEADRMTEALRAHERGESVTDGTEAQVRESRIVDIRRIEP